MLSVDGIVSNIPTLRLPLKMLSLFDIIVSDETLRESLITQKRAIFH